MMRFKNFVTKLSLAFQIMIKGDVEMMAMFYAQRIILGKFEFKNVPQKLKPQVREILIESGLEELATEE